MPGADPRASRTVIRLALKMHWLLSQAGPTSLPDHAARIPFRALPPGRMGLGFPLPALLWFLWLALQDARLGPLQGFVPRHGVPRGLLRCLEDALLGFPFRVLSSPALAHGLFSRAILLRAFGIAPVGGDVQHHEVLRSRRVGLPSPAADPHELRDLAVAEASLAQLLVLKVPLARREELRRVGHLCNQESAIPERNMRLFSSPC